MRALLVALILFLAAAFWPLLFPFEPAMPMTASDRQIAGEILREYGDDLGIFPVLRVVPEGFRAEDAHSYYYFRGYTAFGIPWNKSRVEYTDGRVRSGHVIGTWSQFD